MFFRCLPCRYTPARHPPAGAIHRTPAQSPPLRFFAAFTTERAPATAPQRPPCTPFSLPDCPLTAPFPMRFFALSDAEKPPSAARGTPSLPVAKTRKKSSETAEKTEKREIAHVEKKSRFLYTFHKKIQHLPISRQMEISSLKSKYQLLFTEKSQKMRSVCFEKVTYSNFLRFSVFCPEKLCKQFFTLGKNRKICRFFRVFPDGEGRKSLLDIFFLI